MLCISVRKISTFCNVIQDNLWSFNSGYLFKVTMIGAVLNYYCLAISMRQRIIISCMFSIVLINWTLQVLQENVLHCFTFLSKGKMVDAFYNKKYPRLCRRRKKVIFYFNKILHPYKISLNLDISINSADIQFKIFE